MSAQPTKAQLAAKLANTEALLKDTAEAFRKQIIAMRNIQDEHEKFVVSIHDALGLSQRDTTPDSELPTIIKRVVDSGMAARKSSIDAQESADRAKSIVKRYRDAHAANHALVDELTMVILGQDK